MNPAIKGARDGLKMIAADEIADATALPWQARFRHSGAGAQKRARRRAQPRNIDVDRLYPLA